MAAKLKGEARILTLPYSNSYYLTLSLAEKLGFYATYLVSLWLGYPGLITSVCVALAINLYVVLTHNVI